MTLGQKIRSARIERGLTQKQLVGDHITRNMLSKIENDSATPSVRTLEYIAAQLQLPAGYFLKDSRYSDGTSPDGLDEMRQAYRDGRYADCIRLLEESKDAGTTDEGYLLHTRAGLAAAHDALMAGDYEAARSFADGADYYNREGIYYSAAIDAEMSLILAECALTLDISEFEENAAEYERAAREISFSERYSLARAEYLLKTEEPELAVKLLKGLENVQPFLQAKYHYLCGLYLTASGKDDEAVKEFCAAEEQCSEDDSLMMRIYHELETAYGRRENFKLAYEYATKQLR